MSDKVDEELLKELEELKKIADKKGLTIAEYLKQEAEKILKKQKDKK